MPTIYIFRSVRAHVRDRESDETHIDHPASGVERWVGGSESLVLNIYLDSDMTMTLVDPPGRGLKYSRKITNLSLITVRNYFHNRIRFIFWRGRTQ